MQTNHVLEVALFKVKPEYVDRMVDLRSGLRQALRAFPGLLEYRAYEPVGEGVFADIAHWDSLANALAAARAFEGGDSRFLPYINAIEAVTFMGHFVPEDT